jgi:hypothetical protein
MAAFREFETRDPIDLGQTLRDAAIHLRKVADADATDHGDPVKGGERATTADILDEAAARIESQITVQRQLRKLFAASVAEAA